MSYRLPAVVVVDNLIIHGTTVSKFDLGGSIGVSAENWVRLGCCFVDLPGDLPGKMVVIRDSLFE